MSDAPWANEPFELLIAPEMPNGAVSNNYLFQCFHQLYALKADIEQNSHYAFHAAVGMAHAHNCLLRGLNAIMLQALHIPSAGSPGYNESDVRDLLIYIQTWVKTVHHHHDVEESVMFPEIEKMAGDVGLFSGAVHQHHEFHDGLADLLRLAKEMQTDPAKYSWAKIKAVIDGFAPTLVEHLREEIGLILSLERLDSTDLGVCWKRTEEVAKANGKISFLVSLSIMIYLTHEFPLSRTYIPNAPHASISANTKQYDIFPLVLGCCDKTYQGGNDFPPLPRFMPYAIIYWFGRTHSGAWRFNPCDFWGQPRPLPMLPANR